MKRFSSLPFEVASDMAPASLLAVNLVGSQLTAHMPLRRMRGTTTLTNGLPRDAASPKAGMRVSIGARFRRAT